MDSTSFSPRINETPSNPDGSVIKRLSNTPILRLFIIRRETLKTTIIVIFPAMLTVISLIKCMGPPARLTLKPYVYYVNK